MESFGAISTGDHWRSSDLNDIYCSQEMDDHLPSDCSVPRYELNPNFVNSSLEIPFSIWPNNDSTIVHDLSSFDEIQTYHHFINSASPLRSDELLSNLGDGDGNCDWIRVNQWESCAMNVEPYESACNNSKKRPRYNDDQGLKNKRNVKAKKVNDSSGSETEEDGTGRPVSPTTPLTAFEHSNGSQEELGDGTTSGSSPQGKKTRASRGSATDPQSVYARKRREKINERLKVLQNLVPNGTKVDISTMLEEAVDYVKFLQLQIKLLSADDLWMYAPIAYNGMDIGLDRLRLTAQGLL